MLTEYIDKIKKLEGKELYLCDDNCISANRINIEIDGFSLCHGSAIEKNNKLNRVCENSYDIEELYKFFYEIIMEFQNEDFACRKCPKCKKAIFHFTKMNYFTVNTCRFCNSRCVYCKGHVDDRSAKNPLSLIRTLHEAGLIDKEALFDWGGGEPTLNPFFEETSLFLDKNGYRQKINTNAIVYSNAVFQSLKSGRSIVVVSVDSGTKEGYLKVKGTDNFTNVWINIAKYKKITENINLKYILFNLNSDEKEIDSFYQACIESGINKIILDSEISAYQSLKNCGPFYYTEKEFKAMHYFWNKGLSIGFELMASHFCFSYNERDRNGQLCIPHIYSNNIDYNVITNGVYINACSCVEYFANEIDKSRPIVIFGAGRIGNDLAKILDYECMEYKIMDNSLQKQGVKIGNTVVESVEKTLSGNGNFQVLLASQDLKGQLKQLNSMGVDMKVFWINPASCKNYLYAKNIR